MTSGDIEHDLPLILGHQPVSRALRVRTALSSDEAGDVIVPGLDAVKNIAAQTVLSVALTKLIGADPGLWVTPDALGEPARNLALPLADDSDPAFCEALVTQRNPPDTSSVLQALLGLAEAKVRREVEEFLTERRLSRLLEWLQSASDVLGEDTVGLALEALRVLGEGGWDELDLYRGAAARVEDAVRFFDPARFSARFPMAALRRTRWTGSGRSPRERGWRRQRHPVVAEDLTAHAEHPHVPVGGGVDVAVEHHVVSIRFTVKAILHATVGVRGMTGSW